MTFIRQLKTQAGIFSTASVQSDSARDVHEAVNKDGDMYFNCDEAHLHPHAHKLGGLACVDLDLKEKQQAAIKEWLTKVGKRFMTGNGLASTPAPVTIFEPRSNLQKIADTWVYTHLLDLAAAQTDKLHRLKYVVAWFTAGMRHTFDSWKKPFNPILGETWQSRSQRGYHCFMEQVSHHPPIAAYKMKSRDVELFGTVEVAVSIVINQRGFKQTIKGKRVLRFADGDEIEVTEMPSCITKGVTSSADVRCDVTGRARLNYVDQGMAATLHFGPVPGAEDSLYSRTEAVVCTVTADSRTPGASLFGGSPRDSVGSWMGTDRDVTGPILSHYGENDESVSCHVSGTLAPLTPRTSKSTSHLPHGLTGLSKGLVAKVHAPSVTSWLKSSLAGTTSMAGSERSPCKHVPIATMRGNWLSHMDFDLPGEASERVWTMDDVEGDCFESVALSERLPSDCTFRPDLIALKAGDLVAAQAAKDKLEEIQRRHRKLRPKPST